MEEEELVEYSPEHMDYESASIIFPTQEVVIGAWRDKERDGKEKGDNLCNNVVNPVCPKSLSLVLTLDGTQMEPEPKGEAHLSSKRLDFLPLA
jgi:hypothetical protein